MTLYAQCDILSELKRINWNSEKNRKLLSERGISFEVIEEYISKGHVISIKEHPNQKDYPGQRIFLLNIVDYIYLVPFIENDYEIFLKTIIPSRKATKEYLENDNER